MTLEGKESLFIYLQESFFTKEALLFSTILSSGSIMVDIAPCLQELCPLSMKIHHLN